MTAPADILRRLARLEAETPDDQTVAELLQSDEWIEIEAIALRELAPFPAARADLVRALEDLRSGTVPNFAPWRPTSWEIVRTVVLRALEHHGAARLAIAAAITPEARRA
jgi:hypothetical protein